MARKMLTPSTERCRYSQQDRETCCRVVVCGVLGMALVCTMPRGWPPSLNSSWSTFLVFSPYFTNPSSHGPTVKFTFLLQFNANTLYLQPSPTHSPPTPPPYNASINPSALHLAADHPKATPSNYLRTLIQKYFVQAPEG